VDVLYILPNIYKTFTVGSGNYRIILITMKRVMMKLMIFAISCATTAMANPTLILPEELVGRHHGAMGQYGHAPKDGTISFVEDQTTLGGIELKADGELIVPFALKGESFKNLSFRFHEIDISKTIAVWHPLQDGRNRYSAALFRYGSVFRVLVKFHRDDGSVNAIQWICAEPRVAEVAAPRNHQ
jgi:hypothetical protein